MIAHPFHVAAALAAVLLASPSALASPPRSAPRPPDDVPARLVGGALAGGASYARLAALADGIGARLAGSPGAAAAVAWALRAFEEDGVRGRAEPVRVPHWVRGEERAEVVAVPPARRQPLAVAALGGSAGTPSAGVEAEVVEVAGLDELRALGGRVKGRIVLFQHGMPASGRYGDFVLLRARGPAEAARAGAVGALVRSLATASLRDPHTGQTSFPPGVAPIPAAAVSVEDAELLHRLLARGPVRVRLVLGCGPGDPPEVESANVVAEIRGRERPDEVVVVAAHLDSWDLGTGAVDDATGVAMVLETMRQVARLGIAPRRTLRAVLYMNEEMGLSGGVAYAERHASELPRHVAAIEGDGGADLGPLLYASVPVLSLWQDGSRYFDVHHSAADTLDKASLPDLAAGSAALAVLAWGLAESAETLPRPAPPSEPPWWRPAAPQPAKR